MYQESEYQVRPISLYRINQKSLKNRTKNSLKKLTFTTLRPTHFEGFFVSSKYCNCIFIYQVVYSEKIVHFSRKGSRLPTSLPQTVKASHCPFYY